MNDLLNERHSHLKSFHHMQLQLCQNIVLDGGTILYCIFDDLRCTEIIADVNFIYFKFSTYLGGIIFSL